MKILFLHGWTSVPGGKKPTFLKEHGHSVLNPAIPDEEFDTAVRIAQAEYDHHQPDVIVGSSRGGAIAINIDSGETPLVLLCPAWKNWGTATTVKSNTTILHSRADDGVAFTGSEELVKNSGLPPESLIEIGDDHRLADPEPLKAMLEAVVFGSPTSASTKQLSERGKRGRSADALGRLETIYPNCPTITRTVEVGLLTKSELLQAFERHSVKMNEMGRRLFADVPLTPPQSSYRLETVELKVRHFGFPEGATSAQLFWAASESGLNLCPLEVGPYLRLQNLHQPEGFWIIIASPQLSEGDDYPNGFYLRRLKDGLWLRGYTAAPEHVWDADDRFIFSNPDPKAKVLEASGQGFGEETPNG